MSMLMLAFDAIRISQGNVLDSLFENHKMVNAWSSPFKGVYFIRTNNSVDEVARSLDSLFESRGFILSKINGQPDMTNGRAPDEIWEFIKE